MNVTSYEEVIGLVALRPLTLHFGMRDSAMRNYSPNPSPNPPQPVTGEISEAISPAQTAEVLPETQARQPVASFPLPVVALAPPPSPPPSPLPQQAAIGHVGGRYIRQFNEAEYSRIREHFGVSKTPSQRFEQQGLPRTILLILPI